MRSTRLLLPCLLMLSFAVRADDDGEAMRAAAKRYGPSLVRVEARVYLEVAGLPGVGRAGRRSHRVSMTGLVVDAKGLVVFSSAGLDPSAAAFALSVAALRTWIGGVASRTGDSSEAARPGTSLPNIFSRLEVNKLCFSL